MSQDSRLRLARATQSYWGDRAAWVTVSAGMWTACVKMLSADKDTHVSNIYRERALSLVIFALITCWNDNILAILVKETRFFLSWRRKNSVRGKVVDEKRLIRMGCFGGLPVGRQEGAPPWELNGLQFYSQRKSGAEERTAFFLILEQMSSFHHQLLLHRRRSFLVPAWPSQDCHSATEMSRKVVTHTKIWQVISGFSIKPPSPHILAFRVHRGVYPTNR